MKWVSRISLVIAVVTSIFFFAKYGEDNDIYNGDALGYYSYLPSAICLHNLDSIDKFPKDKDVPEKLKGYFQMYRNNNDITPKGYYINQYTMGVAIFELPFFLVAHAYVKLNGLTEGGYTKPYHTSVMCSSIFYVLLGLFFCFKILRVFYRKDIALLVVSIMLLGSNLFWFTCLQLGMAHNILFFLVALLIYATIRFYENYTIKWFYLCCLVLGFIVVIRPTDIVFGLIPLLYSVDSFKAFIEKILFLFGLRWKLLFAVILFFLPILPQMIFWKVYTGSFIYYSYNGQSFHFLKPKLWEGLFGPDNGWLLYSPIWILSLLAFFIKHKFHGFKVVVIILLPLYFYIIYSWECYQYINGFGSRPMLHIYPLLLIPLAAFIVWIFKKKWLAIIGLSLVAFFVYINLHFSFLNETGRYWSQFSNYKFYKRMLFKNKLSYNDVVYRDIGMEQPNDSSIEPISETISYSISRDTNYAILVDTISPDSVLHITSDVESPNIKMSIPLKPYEKYSPNAYIKVTCNVRFSEFRSNPYAGILMVHKFMKNYEQLTWNGLNIYNKVGMPDIEPNEESEFIGLFHRITNKWETVTAYIPITNRDALSSNFEIWNNAKTEFYLHSFQLQVFKKK